MIELIKIKEKQASKTRGDLYLLNFLFALHFALTIFYISSFLSIRGIPENLIGLVYATGSFLGAISLFLSSILMHRFGNYLLLIILSSLSILVFIILGLVENWWIIILPFFLSFSLPYLIGFSLDIFLENNTINEARTGFIRAKFLTMGNLGFVIAPALGGWLITNNNFTALFLVAALIMIPFLLISMIKLPKKREKKNKIISLKNITNIIKKDKNMKNIFAVNFLLNIFFSIMVVYAPIYMHLHIGLSFQEIGLISSLMLMAFIFIQIPAGKLGDKFLGEKEILITGFIILSISTILVAFVSDPIFWIWGVLLFTTRIGAAMINIMNESYFFKHVNGKNTAEVRSFRLISPIAYTIGPIFSALVLIIAPLSALFIILGVILFSGIWFSAQIEDTK